MIGSNIFCISVNSFITWSKVNPSLPSLIHFSFSVASNNLTLISELTPPKTSKSVRTLPHTDVLYNDLVNLYNEKKKYYGFNEKWFIFGELDPLTFGMMHRINKRIAESADIRRIPLHSFRHSCASLLINTGQPVTTVSKYLGHASTKETLDTYAHMFPNNLTNVKNTIDNLNLGI